MNQIRLLDIYGYNEADIVVMLDGGMVDDPGLAPTRENMVGHFQSTW
jgi:metacaspase-1